MASNDISNDNQDSKLIRCGNCRQNILASKMFLHEGFCSRNNIFCDHCQKVFLKKDYQNHLDNINNKNKNNRNSTKSKKKAKKQKESQNINIFRSPIITKRQTAFEYIEMPTTEELKINNPIIISDGKIVSNKNKNDYLVPYFGIKSFDENNQNNNSLIKTFDENNQNNNSLIKTQDLYEKSDVLNQTELLNVIDSFHKKYDDYKIEIDLGKKMKNSSSMDDLLMANNRLTYNLLYNPFLDQINFEKDNYVKYEDNIYNNTINDIIKYTDLPYKEKSFSNLLINNNDNNNNNNNNNSLIYNNDNNNIDINDNNNYIDMDKDKQNKNKKNNIIINNNIITYNSNNSINKIDNIYNKEEKHYTQNKNTNIDSIKKKILIDRQKDICNIKEPNDNLSKNTFQNYQFSSYIMEKEKKPQNNYSKKNDNKQNPESESTENKNKNDTKKKEKCEFCNSEVDDLVMHYQYYHLKRINEFVIPKKRDTLLLNEKLNEGNTDEIGIDDSKKKILLRELKPNFHAHPNKVEPRSTLAVPSTPYIIKMDKFKKPEKIEKITKKSINVNNSKDNNKRVKKKNGRNAKHLNLKHSNSEDYIKYERSALDNNRLDINTYNSPEIQTGMINVINDNYYNYNPLPSYTEANISNNNYYIDDNIIKNPNNNYYIYQ